MSQVRNLPRFTRCFLALVLAVPLLAAAPQATPEKAKAPTKATGAKAQLPPILDRELFFGNPEISGAQLSPDGKYIAFIKPLKDVRNVWVKKTGEPYSAARPITADPKRPIPGFFWSRDGKQVLFVQDKDGDENFNVYAVNPSAPNAEGKEVPAARNLTDAKGATAQIASLPKNDPDTMFVGLNDRDASWHDLYKVKISTGERTLLRKNTERIAGWVFDTKGELRLAVRTTEKGDTEILRVDKDSFAPIYTCNVFESASPSYFHKDGKHVYLETNKGNRDLSELVIFDPETGKEVKVESDPKGHVDFGSAIFSELTDELVATVYQDEKTRIHFKNKAWEADYNLLQKKLPGREISLGSMTADEQLWMIATYSDVDPGTRYLFDRRTKKLSLEYISREKLPREHMAAMKPITYPSSDGLKIPAYLTLPKGMAAHNLPLVVVPHGGPWARDGWGFNSFAQFLANRGYAVLQPNFRASTGYGKKFLNAGNKQWGDKMQDDITWGVQHLVKNGVVDAKRVGIMGGSYGGYASLAGAAFTPEVYKAAVPIVGPSNLLTLLETIPPYWESFRIIFHERMGNPATPEGKKQLERQSPLFSADKIKTPMLVVQGANDPRVKKAESDQIVIALRDRNFPVEYLCAPDEGHGFHRPVNNMAMFAAAEKFLAKHLGGRFQEGGTPEVMKRLTEITVDPKTVTLAKKVDAGAIGLPKVAADLKVGTATFQGSLVAGTQNFPLNISRVVTEEAGGWRVVETTKLPIMEATDSALVEKGTLALRSRNLKQGPMVLEVAFKDGKATGTMTMNGVAKPISVETGGEVFAEGAGSDDVIATLPLAEGYQVIFRNFDLLKQKIALKQAKVVGAEEIKVPGGSGKAWKVEITSADGAPGVHTLWVAQDSRKVLKTSATLPEMGGAVISSELQP